MPLSFEHVAKTHWVGPYEKPTLVDVSLTLGVGDFVAVWGAQRSGKSTLLRLAAGLELADAGSVRFDGVDLAALPRAARGRLRLEQIGLVQADGPQSAEFSMLDYVALPLLKRCTRSEARTRAMATLSRVGVAECRDAKWRHLSDGERTLASLAHGLVREPRLLLVDDPTAGLDALQQKQVVELLRTAAAEAGVAVLMTSCVLSATTRAHAAFTLGDGRLEPVIDPATASGTVIEFPGGGDQQTA
ncbi:ATP-binding cassette domain-containing protein [Conexibacter woesei]|uniref:ABC transporter related protein n=1 Tax=Conexibacter woesei (strain DSM 14684 / CCUG 47730 / CIP 108061 / JCM 11494 / NBRC 100937 / ID131577) TaxID=469383 RepID=D3F1A1_CONWI|nr:ATP-binding cassette domain-containing protein [Conexibacter woesei]ADB52064.1 ABC transporter related protein [Conexibacter woesei DSM 14684]